MGWEWELVDTYPDFRRELSGDLVSAWLRYMSRHPELLELQLEDLGPKWRGELERAMRVVSERLELVEAVWAATRRAIPRAFERIEEVWGPGPRVVVVLYVGAGCGAGWATEYTGRYAVLVGLETVAELGWHGEADVEGLLVHELAHVAHMDARGLRPREFEELEGDPLFLLYSEGFATRCERLAVTGGEWRVASSPSWAEWCERNLSLLASEYLRRVRSGEPVSDFFGHRLSVFGVSQPGYYLGHEVVRELERRLGLREVATMGLSEVRAEVARVLRSLSQGSRR